MKREGWALLMMRDLMSFEHIDFGFGLGLNFGKVCYLNGYTPWDFDWYIDLPLKM